MLNVIPYWISGFCIIIIIKDGLLYGCLLFQSSTKYTIMGIIFKIEEESTMNTIGELISKKRKEKRLTQKELADLLHLTPSAISKWENDIAVPHISQFPQIAEALQIPVAELYAFTIEDFRYQENVQDCETAETSSIHKRKRLIIIIGIIVLAFLLLGIAIFIANSFSQQPTVTIVDDYYSDKYEHYGYRDIYYVIIEYKGELSEEFLQNYEREIRAQYSDKFEEANLIIVKLYESSAKFDSNADPDMKFILLPQNKE